MKTILNIKIDAIDKNLFLDKIIQFLKSNNLHQIATVNPEFLVDAQKNLEFSYILNQTDLNLIDGVGLQLAYFLKYKQWPARLPGADIVDLLFNFCELNNFSIMLLGGDPGIAEMAKSEIIKKYKNLNIFTLAGGMVEKKENKWKFDDKIISQINLNKPDILLVAFGHPKQEIWIFDHKTSFSTVKVAIGVGGTFDYISKNRKRAPLFYRRFGLEWIYRLYQEPWRWRRIFKAIFIFTYLFITKHEETNS